MVKKTRLPTENFPLWVDGRVQSIRYGLDLVGPDYIARGEVKRKQFTHPTI
jgi:hypothetical protein